MFEITIPEFASPGLSERAEGNNRDMASLEGEKAAIEREASELASIDAFTADPDDVDTRSRKLRQRRHAAIKKEISLAQSRLEIVTGLQSERAAAHEEAAAAHDCARNEVRQGLVSIGLGEWLRLGDGFVIAQIVDFASGPQAASRLLEAIREASHSLVGDHATTRRLIQELTEALRRNIRDVAAVV